MQPTGLFRVGVPEAESLLVAYANGDERRFRDTEKWGHPHWCDTPMHNINYLFRQGTEHKYAYDYETLAKMLMQAGFSSAAPSEFDPAFDSESRRIYTLYVEARK